LSECGAAVGSDELSATPGNDHWERNRLKQLGLFGDQPSFTNRRVKTVTFQGKLGLPVHRWYRLTPSFSPQLALDIADHFRLDGGDLVLDPFSGVATVPLCMKYRGVPAYSIEINPYLYFVGTVKTRTYRDLDAIEVCIKEFLAKLDDAFRTLPPEAGAARYLRDHARYIPRINFPERWWSPGNLMQLVCLRKIMDGYQAEPVHLDLLKMGVLGILVSVSNAKHNHVSLTFAEKPAEMLDIFSVLKKKYTEMVEDLRSVASLPCSDVTVCRGNSKHAASVLPQDIKPTAVITSPPYPNRFSYARETRPHLFFFDFIEHTRAVGELETQAIGGTWGKATSVLSEGVAPANSVIEGLLAPYTKNIRDEGRLMAHYVTKYFNDIFQHAGEIAQVCRRECRLAYVIGNSKFYGHPLPSDEILAAIFGQFGFRLDRIERMRRRQSKTGLYEAVVFMQRN
jgi:hypothetical protein